jgi:iron uptake system component EfeO
MGWQPGKGRHVTARPGAWLVAGIAVATAAAGVAACSASPQANVIAVSTGACGTGWAHPFAGLQTLQLKNESTAAAEVDLIDPANGAVYAEVEALGPGTTAPMQVDVGSGSYAFRCLIEDVDPLTGPVVKVAGHVRGAPAILPITSADLLSAASQYHAYVTAGLQVLAGQTRTLAADVKSGNLAAARPDGLPGGLSDPHFTGFYRLEYGLWHGQSASELTPVATQLDDAVLALSAAFKNMEIDLLDIGLRTHEILENALEFQLTGHDDYGSGTTLATTVANIAGTRELIQVLHPLLAVRDQGLPSVYFWLSRLQALLDAQQSGGHWTPVSALSTSARQQIDAAAGQALTELAPIAVITEPRRA